MITPAYAPTATERVLPRMALDFTTGVLDPRVTIARALDTATRVNSSGFIENINANLPRFDYDPVTLAPKGLLIEEARTNLVLRTAEFNDASWVKSNSTVTANAVTSPDGTVNADKLIPVAAATDGRVIQLVTGSAGATYTLSVFAKQGELTNCRLYSDNGSSSAASVSYDLSTGTVSTAAAVTGTWTGVSTTATNVGNGWLRLTLTWTATSAAPFRISYWCRNTGDGTSGIYVYGAQLEAGAFATSYIPTTTTSLTRNADVVSMTGTNFSDWYNSSEGTFTAWYSSFAAVSVAAKAIVAANDGTTSNRIYSYLSTSARPTLLVTTIGSAQVNMQNDVVSAGASTKTSLAYKVDSFAIATNGGSVTPDTLGTIPTVNRLEIGCFASASNLNGHMQRLFYYPQRLLNAEAQAFSK